jgi:hypothetical protein
MLVTSLERLVALNQPRQSKVFLALQQCAALLFHDVHCTSPKFHAYNCNNFYGFRMLNISSYYLAINSSICYGIGVC